MALIDDLRSTDPTTRVLAVQHVRQTDLDDLDVLAALLEACRDDTHLPESMQPPPSEDPFADFFGAEAFGSKPEPKRATVAETACERLVFTGVIGKEETVAHLVTALQADNCGEALVKAAAKVLGQTLWADRLDAARQLVPVLHGHGAALYEVVVRFGSDEHALMIESALNPYNSRAVNELLNHQGSKPDMEQALRDAVEDGRITAEVDAADVLTLMVAWDSPHLHAIASALEEAFPWALMVRAIDEPAAGERLREWLNAKQPAPVGLVRKLQEGLKTRDDLPHYPLPEWVAYAGTGIDVVRQWGAAARCKGVLESFVEAWDEAPERAWEAVTALVEAGQHASVQQPLLLGLQRDQEVESWNRALFEVLATATPRIDGFVEAATDVLRRHPLLTRAVIPALMQGYDAPTLRPLVETYIGWCETKPVIRKPSRPGLIHEEREGVDPVPLQQLVNFLGDDALGKRLQEVLPYVRSA